MSEWRGEAGLLQHATQDRFTVVWQYEQGADKSFAMLFYTKNLNLPRQARDTHRES
jgi:hypothetical protein